MGGRRDDVHRHNQPYKFGVIYFTHRSVGQTVDQPPQLEQIGEPERAPAAAIVTNTPGSAASVQPTGSENCRPCASRKNTRSCDHVCRTARNTNSRPTTGGTGESPEQFADH